MSPGSSTAWPKPTSAIASCAFFTERFVMAKFCVPSPRKRFAAVRAIFPAPTTTTLRIRERSEVLLRQFDRSGRYRG